MRRFASLTRWLLNTLAEAMDRIHRLGQHRPVQAIKLVIEDSIESRIIQVCIVLLLLYAWALTTLIASREKVSYGRCNIVD